METAVKERYTSAAGKPEAALCCPVDYNPQYLQAIPAEVIEKDYGCGDPSQHLKPGETVLDLGSGTGKICFIAAQVVGPQGQVIGIDMTDSMLEVARRNAPIVAGRIGFANVEFRKGRIQDLALDLERADRPLVADSSIDVVVSNCVLNLVESQAKKQLFTEIFRVLRDGGRAVISDIVSDEPVPAELQANEELWSGCISGAFTEHGFLQAFLEAGFNGVEILSYDLTPWRTVEGIEFHSITVQAFKRGAGAALERNQAVIYKGPFAEVVDDSGNRMQRGRRYAVSDRLFTLYQRAPYACDFIFLEPRVEVPAAAAAPFACDHPDLRDPRETKGQAYRATTTGSSCCG